MVRLPLPDIDVERCTGCGDCVVVCPTGAVKVVDGKAVMVSPDVCLYCTDCEPVCPAQAIRCPLEIILGGNES
ncbi:MAG: 4Fe-4S dicluster domain-containing protein [Dehalococcoidales bacterium]|nr:4Fe-4S dicluster domain-containing protein [Dehalococcoidales bacterium]